MQSKKKKCLHSYRANFGYSTDLKKWRIFNFLPAEITSQIHMIMAFGYGNFLFLYLTLYFFYKIVIYIFRFCKIIIYIYIKLDAALIVTKDKIVYGLGNNYSNQLGIGNISNTLQPKKIDVLCGKNIKTFCCNNWMASIFALTEEGEV